MDRMIVQRISCFVCHGLMEIWKHYLKSTSRFQLHWEIHKHPCGKLISIGIEKQPINFTHRCPKYLQCNCNSLYVWSSTYYLMLHCLTLMRLKLESSHCALRNRFRRISEVCPLHSEPGQCCRLCNNLLCIHDRARSMLFIQQDESQDWKSNKTICQAGREWWNSQERSDRRQ